jgi:nitroreductase
MNEVLQAIYERRAVRRFLPRPVPEDLIGQLIDAGRMAPSAMNRQPWYFLVVTGPARLKRLGEEIAEAARKEVHLLQGMSPSLAAAFIFHGAPVVLFITAPADNEWAELDVGMCAQNIMLAARSLGLDTCPVGLARYAEKTPSYAGLGIPAGHRIMLALVLGYGDEKPVAHARRKDNLRYLYWE